MPAIQHNVPLTKVHGIYWTYLLSATSVLSSVLLPNFFCSIPPKQGRRRGKIGSKSFVSFQDSWPQLSLSPLPVPHSPTHIPSSCWISHLYPLRYTLDALVSILPSFPGSSDGKESACQCRRPRIHPWGRTWQPTPVLVPRESHGQGNLVGYSPWGHKQSDMTEQLTFPYFCPTPRDVHFLKWGKLLSLGENWKILYLLGWKRTN